MSLTLGEFRSALSTREDWRDAVAECLGLLGDVADGTLGFLYCTDEFAEHAGAIVMALAGESGVKTWIGTVGMGVIGRGREVFDGPGVSILVGHVPDQAFLPFGPVGNNLDRLRRDAAPWFAAHTPQLGIVHADPRSSAVPGVICDLADVAGGFLTGGLASSRGEVVLIGGGLGEAHDGGISGVLLDRSVGIATAMSQGCAPIGPVRAITESEDNIVKQIDDRPALEVFKAELGPELSKDLRRLGGTVFAGLPVPGSESGDYRVRPIMAVDPSRGWIVIGDAAVTGQPILFVRRDRDGAAADLARALARLKARLPGPPKAALYVSCVARGPNLFGAENEEVRMVAEVLGEIPLAGFFANGEISRDQLYSYTGVITVFT